MVCDPAHRLFCNHGGGVQTQILTPPPPWEVQSVEEVCTTFWLKPGAKGTGNFIFGIQWGGGKN